jgi:hypothetical protein
MESVHEEGQQLVTQLRELSAKANAGDAQALHSLRTLLADDRRLVDQFGDLARHIEFTWLNKLAADNVLTREAVREYLDQLRATLAGAQPTAIEKLLIDQVVICSLADRHAALLQATGTDNPHLVALRCRQAESAQKRLLAAVKMLTTLRSLVPAGFVPAQPRSHVERAKLSA